MKKVFGQTVRDLKRGVNKKVLKVSGIEQKILDATSNELLGPHVSVMAELAQASRNYHECQLIMSVIWKRINDTGKNWRHVFKALTVLEYLVAHGSERVIDEIREHAYQISTLADFQYIDSNGRDQGSNVRRKSQVLVALVNSKERIQEIRQKAQSNKDKYNGTPSGGDCYENGHNGNRDDERSGYGREREFGYKDDDRYGKGRDSFSNDGRDYDERYGKDNYREGNSDGSVDYQTRPRSQSVDGYTDRSFHDDDRNSSRSGGKADDQSQDESVGGPPSYEEATSAVQNTTRDERDGENVAAPSQVSSAPISKPISPPKSTNEGPASDIVADTNNGFDAFDEFDPRGPASAASPAASNQELDIFGFSAPDSANSLAMVATNSTATTFEDNFQTDSVFGTNFATLSSATASTNQAQASEDPFGDTPFKAIPQDNFQSQPQNFQPVNSLQPSLTLPSAAPKDDSFASFDFGNGFGGLTYAPNDGNGQHPSGSPSFSAPKLPAEQSSDDILDSILPRTGFYSQEAQSAGPTNMQTAQMNFLPHPELSAQVSSQGIPTNSQNFQTNPFQSSGFSASATNAETVQMNPFQTSGQSAPVASQESPTDSQDLFLHSTASQGSPRNVQSTQENFLQPVTSQGSVSNMPTGTLSPQGPHTNVQSAEINFFRPPGSPTQGNFSQPSGVSVPATSQGSVTNMPSGTSVPPQGPQTNMQSAEMNFFQPPELSGQLSQGNMQPAQMNLFQPSGVSVPATSQGSATNMPSGTSVAPQGPQTNMQSAEMNFFQPPELSGQLSQGNMQPAQMNLFQASGISESPDLPESFTTPQATNMSFFPPSGLPSPIATTSPTNMHTTQTVSPTHVQSGQFNLASQSILSEPRASQETRALAPINMQAAQSGPQITMQTAHVNHWSQPMLSDPLASKMGQVTAPNYMQVTVHAANMQPTYLNLSSQPTLSDSRASQTAHAAAPGNTQATQFGSPAYIQTSHVNPGSHSMLSDPFAPQAPPATAVLSTKTQSTEKFQPKSTIWADTLSRGLVNFNISGPKTNPLDVIGVDFDAINRKEKRLEAKKSSAPPAVSTITMGKAMGSGSGLGRTAAGGLAPPPNPMMGSGTGGMGMGMGMGGGGGMGMGMGGYGGNMNQPPMGMMNMAMRPGAPGWPPNGMLPQAPGMPGSGYNPTMGMGGYGMQQPYGGGYR